MAVSGKIVYWYREVVVIGMASQERYSLQPCERATSVAVVVYYLAKYASKYQPKDAGDIINGVIFKGKRRGCHVKLSIFRINGK